MGSHHFYCNKGFHAIEVHLLPLSKVHPLLKVDGALLPNVSITFVVKGMLSWNSWGIEENGKCPVHKGFNTRFNDIVSNFFFCIITWNSDTLISFRAVHR